MEQGILWDLSFSGHSSLAQEDSYNARISKEPGQFKDRNEIPRNKRLNVNIIRGRG